MGGEPGIERLRLGPLIRIGVVMKLQIERPYFEAMVTSFPGLASLREQLRFGDRVEVAFGQLRKPNLAT